MSTKNNLEEGSRFSLFDPKTGKGIPAIEGGFEEDYEVDEEYIEAEEVDIDMNDEDDDDFNNYTEEAEELPVFADEDEDEE